MRCCAAQHRDDQSHRIAHACAMSRRGVQARRHWCVCFRHACPPDSERAAFRTSQESSEWTAHLVQNEALLISGVAEVTVTTGEVECWGTRLSPGSTQLVATSGPDAALSLRAVPTQSKGLARLASADISIRAVSGGCDVGTSLSDLRGVQHDESACPEAWTEVRRSESARRCQASDSDAPVRMRGRKHHLMPT